MDELIKRYRDISTAGLHDYINLHGGEAIDFDALQEGLMRYPLGKFSPEKFTTNIEDDYEDYFFRLHPYPDVDADPKEIEAWDDFLWEEIIRVQRCCHVDFCDANGVTAELEKLFWTIIDGTEDNAPMQIFENKKYTEDELRAIAKTMIAYMDNMQLWTKIHYYPDSFEEIAERDHRRTRLKIWLEKQMKILSRKTEEDSIQEKEKLTSELEDFLHY